jgi:2-polyprenyl-6-hydroxyphenyl methylase/3-demethylubiquinone-9 3-methyltransferase
MTSHTLQSTPSVDPQEVARYAAMADTWWDKTGPFWPLHRLNELRVVYIRDKLCQHFQRDAAGAEPLSGLDTLDIGCGGGILSESMACLGARVQGIDVVDRNIRIARHHAQQTGVDVNYEMITAETLAEHGRQYDVVLNMEVVEHVADLTGFLHACVELVKPGGVMFIATINRTPLSWLTAIVGAEYILRWLPRGTHQWKRFPKPEELKRLLSGNRMHLLAETGVQVNPLTRRMSLTKYMGVNYMLFWEKQVEFSRR